MDKQAFVMIGKCMIEVGYENLQVIITHGNDYDRIGVIEKVSLSQEQGVVFTVHMGYDIKTINNEWLDIA